MNDLDLDLDRVRAFRSDAPHLTGPAALPGIDFTGRDAAEDAAAQGAVARGRRRSTGRLVSAAALVVGAAGFLALQSGPGAAPSEAAVALNRAAAIVAAERAERPADGQWFFTSRIGNAAGQPVDLDPALRSYFWETFDGTRYAEASSDDLSDVEVATIPPDLRADSGSREEDYDATNALPSDPGALLAALMDSDLVTPRGETQAARDYNAVVSVFDHRLTLVSPQVQANLLRALATIPGVEIDRDAAPDPLGRPTMAVSLDQEQQLDGIRVRSQLLLDPTTYDFMGTRTTALEPGEVARGFHDPSDPDAPETVEVETGETYRQEVVVGPVPVAHAGDEVDPVTGEVTHHHAG